MLMVVRSRSTGKFVGCNYRGGCSAPSPLPQRGLLRATRKGAPRAGGPWWRCATAGTGPGSAGAPTRAAPSPVQVGPPALEQGQRAAHPAHRPVRYLGRPGAGPVPHLQDRPAERVHHAAEPAVPRPPTLLVADADKTRHKAWKSTGHATGAESRRTTTPRARPLGHKQQDGKVQRDRAHRAQPHRGVKDGAAARRHARPTASARTVGSASSRRARPPA